MPAVSERFETYRDFASASLFDIYGSKLDAAYKVTANHLESGIWINNTVNNGSTLQFVWQPFPWSAQLSPINDIASGDFNSDGNIELILAQNHYSNWLETGLWRGSPGCHLEWTGNGFATIPHEKSGIFLPNDTKAILATDLNGDGHKKILATQNNANLLIFRLSKEK